MEKNKSDNRGQGNSMKQVNPLTVLILLFFSSILSSCEAIAGIFSAGMGFGIFIVIAIVVLIAFFLMKAGKNKT